MYNLDVLTSSRVPLANSNPCCMHLVVADYSVQCETKSHGADYSVQCETKSHGVQKFLCAVVIFIDILLCIKWSYCVQWYTYILESPLVLHLSEYFNYLNTLQSNVFG